MFICKDTEMSGLICFHSLLETTTERNNSLQGALETRCALSGGGAPQGMHKGFRNPSVLDLTPRPATSAFYNLSQVT